MGQVLDQGMVTGLPGACRACRGCLSFLFSGYHVCQGNRTDRLYKGLAMTDFRCEAVASEDVPDTGISVAAQTAALAAAAFLAACSAEVDPADPDAWPANARDPASARYEPTLLRRSALAYRAGSQRQPDVQTLLDWAEQQYPLLFPSHESNRNLAPYVYRFYPGSGNYVGVAGSDVYVLGPVSNGELLRVGALADFAAMVYPRFAPTTREQAARFLLHAQVGLVDEEIDTVMSLGYEGWLQAQFELPPGQSAWDWLESRGYGINDQNEYESSGAPFFDLAAFRQMVTAPDGLRKRIQVSLTEYFVVSLASAAPSWPHFSYATFWDGLGQHAFGNFRELLEFVTLSVAMGVFLNTAGNQKEDLATGRVPDENYAREVMQLFTIGLHQLHPDGMPRLDAQGRPIETYGADDVSQLARVFTGYEVDESGPRVATVVGNRTVPTHPYSKRPMRFTPERRSTLQARFLGATVPAGASGAQALKIALDALFNHPNVGPFFGRQLIQRLVTSNPSPAYVGRVAAAFANNGQGVRGDMQAVIAAVLLDEEARGDAGLTSPDHGKLREPALRIVQWAKTFRLSSKAGSWKFGLPSQDPSFDFGQRLFWSPSVFNFFRPGFVPPGTALAATGATAPEFQIVNEASVAQYANALMLFILEGPWVFAPDRPDNNQSVPSALSGVGDMLPDYSREISLAHDAEALLDRLNLLLSGGQLSAATRRRLAAALQQMNVTPGSDARTRQGRVAQAVLMVMLCPEYLVQK